MTDSAISWTDHTGNLWWGCVEISPGCNNCYAKVFAARHGHEVWGVHEARRMGKGIWGHFKKWLRDAAAEGTRRRVFVGSMMDIFESLPKDHPQREEMEEARRIFFAEVVPDSPNLDFILLTKRVGNVAKMIPPEWLEGGWPSNAWLLITVVNQDEADRDVPKLLALPAPVRGLSCEPLIGPVDLTPWLYEECRECEGTGHVSRPSGWEAAGTSGDCDVAECGCEDGLTDDPREDGLGLVIVGGESGAISKIRKMELRWARQIHTDCVAAGVAVHMKQLGTLLARELGRPNKGDDLADWPENLRRREFPAVAGGEA